MKKPFAEWLWEDRLEAEREDAELRAEVGEENWPQFLRDLEELSKAELEKFEFIMLGGRLS